MSPRTFVPTLLTAAAGAFCFGFISAPTPPAPSQADEVVKAAGSDASPTAQAAPAAAPSSSTAEASPEPAGPGSVEAVFDALGKSTVGARSFEITRALARLDATQIGEVLSELESVGRGDQYLILPRAIDRLMELEPERALAWMRENATTYREGSSSFVKAFEVVLHRDFAAAQKIFEELPAGDRRNELGKSLLEDLAARSPEKAKELLKTVPAGAARDLANQGYVTGLSKADPVTAIELATKWPDGAAQDTALAKAFARLTQSNLARAIDLLDSVKRGIARGRAFNSMVEAASDAQMADLVAYFERTGPALRDFVDTVNTTARLADGWARKDPTAALAWAKTLSGPRRDGAVKWALINWARTEPEAALNASISENNGQQLDLEIFNRCLTRNFSLTRAWAEKLPPGAPRDAATQRVVWTLAARGEEGAAQQLAQALPEAKRQTLGLDIAGSLAAENPALAARWLEPSANDPRAAEVFGRVAATWARADLKGAGGWANKLPAGAGRDAAVARYAREVVGIDPSTAAEWAASISNESARASMIGSIAFEWAERDPAAAKHWLEATPALDAKRREMLRSFLP